MTNEKTWVLAWIWSLLTSYGAQWEDIGKASVLLWRRWWHPTPVPLPGNSRGWRSLVGCSPRGREELDTTEWLHFHFSLSCIGEGNGNPLQCSCLENPRDEDGAVYGVTQSRTWLKWLSSSSSSVLLRGCLESVQMPEQVLSWKLRVWPHGKWERWCWPSPLRDIKGPWQGWGCSLL